MRISYIVLAFIMCISCDSQHHDAKGEINDRKAIIEFLKTEYHVTPRVDRFDSIYLSGLRSKEISLDIDSLINSKLTVLRCTSLPVESIEYDNRFEYKDRVREDFFTLSLIRNTNTGKIYLDLINPDAGMITEDYCAVSWIKSMSEKQAEELSSEDLKSFNGIEDSRIFGKYETKAYPQRRGAEAFLNDQFRFTKPSKTQLDSFFKFYDESAYHHWDTLITSPAGLYKYLTRQAAIIRSQNNYGYKDKYLSYLKQQISLLLMRESNSDSTSSFLWIYKDYRRLRIRHLFINGTIKSGFTYFVNEETLCFP